MSEQSWTCNNFHGVCVLFVLCVIQHVCVHVVVVVGVCVCDVVLVCLCVCRACGVFCVSLCCLLCLCQCVRLASFMFPTCVCVCVSRHVPSFFRVCFLIFRDFYFRLRAFFMFFV